MLAILMLVKVFTLVKTIFGDKNKLIEITKFILKYIIT